MASFLCRQSARIIASTRVHQNRAISIHRAAANEIKLHRKPGFEPKLGLILGSGMQDVAQAIVDPVEIPFSELGFPHVGSVSGHAAKVLLGTLNGVEVVCYQGRTHLYEGISATSIRPPIYTLKELGVEKLIVTAAVGSLNKNIGPGELVAVTDHINLQGVNPLVGTNDPIGDRFVSMQDAYSPRIRKELHDCANELDIFLGDGVYVACMGPSFETPAEIRAFGKMGADVVGMSTVGEVIVARHCGIETAAIGVVVNYAAGLTDNHITHEETLHFGGIAGKNVSTLLSAVASRV